MLPVVEAFNMKYSLDKLLIIADAGLKSKKNIMELSDKEYEFILGEKIKNEFAKIKMKIL